MKKEISIHLLTLETIRNNLARIVSSLAKERIEKANRHLKEEDRFLSLGGSYLIQKYTGASPLLISKTGKPFKEGENFSISHSGDYVVFVKNESDIGIDIQKERKIKDRLIDFVMSEKEKRSIKENQDFFKMWCLKESLVKCTGDGLSGNLKRIPAKVGTYSYKKKKYTSFSIGGIEGYCLAITIANKKNVSFDFQYEEF